MKLYEGYKKYNAELQKYFIIGSQRVLLHYNINLCDPHGFEKALILLVFEGFFDVRVFNEIREYQKMEDETFQYVLWLFVSSDLPFNKQGLNIRC